MLGRRLAGPAFLGWSRHWLGECLSGCALEGLGGECVVEFLYGVPLSLDVDFVVHVRADVDGVSHLCSDDGGVGVAFGVEEGNRAATEDLVVQGSESQRVHARRARLETGAHGRDTQARAERLRAERLPESRTGESMSPRERHGPILGRQ